MSRKKAHLFWFVHPCDGETRHYVVVDLNLSNFFDEVVEDIDNLHQKRNENLELFKLHSHDEVQLLNENKLSLRLNLKIFVQDDPDGKIYRWPFDEGARPLGRKTKSR